MKHEHTVELTLPESVKNFPEKIADHFEENKEKYLYALTGLAVGVIGTRSFSRSVSVVVVVTPIPPQ